MMFDDTELFAPTPATPTGARGRRCSRHVWEWTEWMPDDSRVLESVQWCARCHVLRDATKVQRGRHARRSGNDAERDLARRLGGKRVGQYGSPVDVEVPEYMVIQSKRGAAFPERIWSWLQALPNDGRLRAVYLSDAPGGGHPRRELLCVPLSDYLAWHITPREDPK